MRFKGHGVSHDEEKKKTEETGGRIKISLEQDKIKLAELQETRKNKITGVNNAKQEIIEYKKDVRANEVQLIDLREKLEVIIQKLLDAISKRKAELMDSENERQQVRDIIWQ